MSFAKSKIVLIAFFIFIPVSSGCKTYRFNRVGLSQVHTTREPLSHNDIPRDPTKQHPNPPAVPMTTKSILSQLHFF
jgi:hypothetical protein